MEFNEVLNPNGRVAASHKQRTMKTTYTNPEAFESTYALLVRSEEKQRVETLIYTLLGRDDAIEDRARFDDRVCRRATRRVINLIKGVSSFSVSLLC